MKHCKFVFLIGSIFFFHNYLIAQNHSLSFDGTDDYVHIPTCEAFTNDEFTIEAWFKAAQTGVQQTILLAYKDIPSKNGQIQCEVDRTGVFRFNYRPFVAALGGTNLYSTSIISDNTWHHFSVVKQNQILALYIDGQLEKYEFGTFDNIADAPEVDLGRNKYDDNEQFRKYSGKLDDLKIWTKAKTNQEILDTYLNEHAGDEAALFTNYKMDETLDLLFDCSVHQHHGQRIGAAGLNNQPQYDTDVPQIADVACTFDTPPTTTCTSNLLQNADFNQNLNNWNGTGGTIQNSKLSLCNQGDLLRQTIAAEANKTYQLHFTAKTNPSGGNVTFGIKFLDASWIPLADNYSSFDSPSGFSSNFIELVAPSGSAYVEVVILKENGGCVEVEEVCLTTDGGSDPCDNDVIAPTISNCPSNISQTTTTQTANVTWTAPTATDNCGTPSLSANYASGASFSIGTTQVLYTATDGANNTATCAFKVNISEQNIGGDCAGNLLENSGYEFGGTAWNNGVVLSTSSYSGSYANSICSNGSSTIQTVPVHTDKQYSLQVFTKRSGDAFGFISLKYLDSDWMPLSSGNSGIFNTNYQLKKINEPTPADAVYVEVSVRNLSGTGCIFVDDWCLQSENSDPCMSDIEAPTIANCPSDISQTTSDPSTTVTWTAPTATDNCGTPSLSANYASDSSFPIGTTQVLYTATDAVNNTATCAFSITISEQNTGGSCTNNLIENGDFNNNLQGWQVAGATVENGHLRLCNIGEFARQTQLAEGGKNYRFVYSAKTAGNNQNVLFGIKFLNASWSPIGSEWSSFDSPIGFESDFIEAIAPIGTAWIEVNILKQNTGCVLVDDLCLSADFDPDPCFMDEEPPVFTVCPEDTTVYTLEPSVRVEWEQPLAIDNCGAVTVSGNATIGQFFYKYPYTVVYTAKDETENSATCTFVVTVRDPNTGDICADNMLTNGNFQNGLSNWQNNGAIIESGFLKLCTPTAKVSQLVPAMDTSSYVLAYSLSTPSPQDSLQTTIRFYASDSQTELGAFQKKISTTGYLVDKFLGLIPPTGTAFIGLEIKSTVNTCIEIANICLVPENPGDCTYDYIPPTINGCPSDTAIYISSLPAVYRYSNNTQAIDNCSIKSFSRGFNEVLQQVGENEIVLTAYDQADNQTDCKFTINVLLDNIPINCSNSLLSNSEFSTSNAWSTIGGSIQNGNLQLCNEGDIAQQTVAGEAGQIYKLQYNAKTLSIGQNVLFGLKFLSANYQPIGDMYSSFDSPGAFSSNFIQAEAPHGTAWVEVAIIKENDGCIQVNEVCLSKRIEIFTSTTPCSAFEMEGYGAFAGFTQTGGIKIYRDYFGIKKMIHLNPEGDFLYSEALGNHSYVSTPWSVNGTTLKHRETNEMHALPQIIADRFTQRVEAYKSTSKYLFAYSTTDSKAILLQTDFSFNIVQTDTVQQNFAIGLPQAMWVNEGGQVIIRFFAQTHNFYGATRGGAHFAFLDADFNSISGITKTNPTESWLSEQVFQVESMDGGSFSGHGIQGVYHSSSTGLLAPTFAYDRLYTSSYSTTSHGRGASSTSSGSTTSISTKSFPTNENIMARWGGGSTAYYRPSNGFYGPNGGTTYSSNTIPATVNFTNNKTINIGSTGGFHAPISTNGKEFLIFHRDGRTIIQKVGCNPNSNEQDIKIELSAVNTNPGQWKNTSFVLEVINEGSQAMNNIQVQLPPQSDVNFRDQIAYVSHTAPAGSTFNSWIGIWEIPNVAAGQSITLSYEAFTKTATAIPIFAQVTAQSPADADSSPNNNSTAIPAEDDEALLVLNDVMPLQQGTSQAPEQGDARIFPNPVSRVLYMDLSDYEGEEITISMIDAYGRIALSHGVALSHPVSMEQIDVQSLENGLYFLKIESVDKRPVLQRVVVEHGQ